MSSDETHPEWCGNDHAGHFHETLRDEFRGRNGAVLNVQVNDYGSGPFVSASVHGGSASRGGTFIERDPEMVTGFADMLDVLAGAGAKAMHDMARKIRQANVTAYGPDPEAEA